MILETNIPCDIEPVVMEQGTPVSTHVVGRGFEDRSLDQPELARLFGSHILGFRPEGDVIGP